MPDTSQALGIIAGSRSLPLVVASQARQMGVGRLVAVAFAGETDPELAPLVDDIVWIKVGQLSKLIAGFRDRGIARCVMAGQISPKNLFDLRPDFRALALLLKLRERNAHSLFGGIADELKKDGIELISAVPWLAPLMPGPQYQVGPKLSDQQRADISLGFRIAKEVSRLEIGQTVVVKKGTVLAVEGFEGTDVCLARGGLLAGKDRGAVAVKVAKEKHDLRFDLPCIGPQTVEVAGASGLSAIAVEAGRTLWIERDTIETLAAQLKVTVTTVSG